MTPPNWNHVDHQITREVLEQKSIDEDSICQALVFAAKCLEDDKDNEDVTKEMFYFRASYLTDAEESWNEHGDTNETVKALQKFWSV